MDVQVLNVSKLGNDQIANQLIVNVQVGRGMPEPVEVEKVVNGHTPLDFNTSISRQPTPNVVDAKNKINGTLVIGSTGKTSMEPLTGAPRIAVETKS